MTKGLVCVNFYGHNEPLVVGKPAGFIPDGKVIRTTGRMLRREHVLNAVSEAKLLGLYRPPGSPPNNSSLPRWKPQWVYDYNSGLSDQDHQRVAVSVLDEIVGKGPIEQTFMITGYSAGGASALHLGRLLKKKGASVLYIGLADPGFQRGESEYLMTHPEVSARYMKNYFQTLGNREDVAEIHDAVVGFHTNYNLNDRMDKSLSVEELHDKAVKLGNDLMLNDVKWCIGNCAP